MIRIAITAAALIQGIGAVDAETLTCSQWQDIHTCSGANGYVSHETQWQGMTIGDDNRGNRWTRSDWQGRNHRRHVPAGAVIPRRAGDPLLAG